LNNAFYKKNVQEKLEVISTDIKLDRNYYYKIIQNIGEPVLHTKLLDMYNDLFPNENMENIKKQIIELGERIGYEIELKKKE